MKMRRWLTAFVAVVMLLSAVPFGATAVGETGESGKVYLDKTATLENDGSYTIKMEAFATGKTTTQTITTEIPLDIVLVLDQSGSMLTNKLDNITYQEKLKEEVQKFIERVEKNGKEAGVTHRMAMVGFASGPLESDPKEDNPDKQYNWLGTGVFDNTGTFVKYKDAEAGTSVIYNPYNGQLVPGEKYYVQLSNGAYAELTYDQNADKYVQVVNPGTDRKDLYGKVEGSFVPAVYGPYNVLQESQNPVYNDGKAYYDAQGHKLIWQEKTDTIYKEITGSIDTSKTYYINTGTDKAPQWVKLSYVSASWFSPEKWEGNNGKSYDATTDNQFQERLLFGNGTKYPAYEQVTAGTGEFFLTADGKTPVSPVYEYVKKDGWNVNGTPVSELYEKSGVGAWQYKNEQGVLVTFSTERVYTAEVKSVYASALVPVTDGPDGQGEITQSLLTAKDNILAEGATRTSLGIDMANKIFEHNPIPVGENRKRVMIVFTDGQPGYNGADNVEIYKTISESYETKHTYGATVYTIGLYSKTPEKEVTDFLAQVSSDYPDANYEYIPAKKPASEKDSEAIMRFDNDDALAKYIESYFESGVFFRRIDRTTPNWRIEAPAGAEYFEYDTKHFHPGTEVKPAVHSKAVTNSADLEQIFETISQEIGGSTTTVELDERSILRDIMSTEGFELTGRSAIEVKVVPGTASENATTGAKLIWDEAKAETVVKMTALTNGKTETGTYHCSDGTEMKICAGAHMDPSNGQPHTVDVFGFDYKDQYIAKAHPGAKLQVIITGVKALPSVTTDKNIKTNDDRSGIWAPVDATGEHQLKAPFPVKPQTHMTSKSYVVDYAKPLDLAVSDFKMTGAQNVDISGYNPFTTAVSEASQKYGNVTLTNGKLTYTPKTMQWDGYDTFYVFGKTEDAAVLSASANKVNSNLWSKVNVIPANNVYYEDTFVDTTGENPNGTVGITYTGEWTEEQGAHPGENAGSAETSAQNDTHGWIPAMQDDKGDSDGTAHKISGTGGAKASFKFTGTGVDVYSRTSNATGVIYAELWKLDPDGAENFVAGKMVDTLSASGTYYQIPTLNFHANDVFEDGSTYQMPYGNYRVDLYVTANVQERLEYYLDGIRIYNPLVNGDSTVNDAYGPAEENAAFMEVRDLLIDQSNQQGTTTLGPVFIDQAQDGTVPSSSREIGVYKEFGPKNEVYLAKGQMISFKVNSAAGNQFSIGLKSPTGMPVKAGYTGADGNVNNSTFTHSTDMYYTIGAAKNGMVSIMNNGDSLLAITKLKVTNAAAPVDVDQVFAEVPVATLLSAAEKFCDPDQVTEDPQSPAEPDVTVPETTEPDVEIVTPEAHEDVSEKPAESPVLAILDKIFDGVRRWFGR